VLRIFAVFSFQHQPFEIIFLDQLEKLRRVSVHITDASKGEAAGEKHRWFNPKTKKGRREIPIPGELVTALRAWKEKYPKSRLDLIFCNEFGEPCNRTGIGRYGLAPALEQAKIKKAVTPHGPRHTYASMLIALSRPITEVSEYLGHADVSITMRVYAHFLKQKKQDAMSDLERLIQNG
jgi:integrase